MSEVSCPERWTAGQAVVTLPDRIDEFNADQVSDQLLSVISRGATELIADMTGTVSCDHAGADAMVRAYQRAAACGTQLRLVIIAEVVRRVISLNGLDRLIPVYPSLEAATAVPVPAMVIPSASSPSASSLSAAGDGQVTDAAVPRPRMVAANGPELPAISRVVLVKLVDALADGVALAGDDGLLALVNRRTEEMFGYEPAELTGRLVESLIPADQRAVHRAHRTDYARAPRTRAMGEGMRLVGLRKNGTTFPVQVSLSPVLTATGHLTLAVIRDLTDARQSEDLMDIARALAAAEQAELSQEVLDRVLNGLFEVGLSLRAAIDLPSDQARQQIVLALRQLDDAIVEIREHAFDTRVYAARPDVTPPGYAD